MSEPEKSFPIAKSLSHWRDAYLAAKLTPGSTEEEQFFYNVNDRCLLQAMEGNRLARNPLTKPQDYVRQLVGVLDDILDMWDTLVRWRNTNVPEGVAELDILGAPIVKFCLRDMNTFMDNTRKIQTSGGPEMRAKAAAAILVHEELTTNGCRLAYMKLRNYESNPGFKSYKTLCDSLVSVQKTMGGPTDMPLAADGRKTPESIKTVINQPSSTRH